MCGGVSVLGGRGLCGVGTWGVRGVSCVCVVCVCAVCFGVHLGSTYSCGRCKCFSGVGYGEGIPKWQSHTNYCNTVVLEVACGVMWCCKLEAVVYASTNSVIISAMIP